MSKKSAINAKIFFCDDVRRELGGRISFMGTIGPIVEDQDTGPTKTSAVAIISCPYNTDLSKADLKLLISIDGAEDETRPFPVMSKSMTSIDRKPPQVTWTEQLVPGFVAEMYLVGVLRVEGLMFKRTLDIRAMLDGSERARVIFVRDTALQEMAQPTSKAPPKATPKNALGSKPKRISRKAVSASKSKH